MNLFKDGKEKEVTSPKVIERLIREGWMTNEKEAREDEGDFIPEEQPKKRGRPAKKED